MRTFQFKLRAPGKEALQKIEDALETCRLFYNEEVRRTRDLFDASSTEYNRVKALFEREHFLPSQGLAESPLPTATEYKGYQKDLAKAYKNHLKDTGTKFTYEGCNYKFKGESKRITAYRDGKPLAKQLNRNMFVESASARLERAWTAFRKKWAQGIHPSEAGIPRFTRYGEFGALTFVGTGIKYHPPVSEAEALPVGAARTHRIELQGFGIFRMLEKSRPIPEGWVLKSVSLIKKPDGWYVSLVLDDSVEPACEPRETGYVLGINRGIRNFVMTSRGSAYHLADIRGVQRDFLKESAEKRLPWEQRKARRIDGCKARGKEEIARIEAMTHLGDEEKDKRIRQARRMESAGLREAKRRIARIEMKGHRGRTWAHYEAARRLLKDNSGVRVIVADKLDVQDMLKRPEPKEGEGGEFLPNGAAHHAELAKGIINAGWAAFLTILKQQAEKVGVRVEVRDAKNITQECAECGTLASPKHNYWEPVYKCGQCGAVRDSDQNAAQVLVKRYSAETAQREMREFTEMEGKKNELD